jgi:hypothetical protein
MIDFDMFYFSRIKLILPRRLVAYDSRIDSYIQLYCSIYFYIMYLNINQFTFNSILVKIKFAESIHAYSIILTAESNIH